MHIQQIKGKDRTEEFTVDIYYKNGKPYDLQFSDGRKARIDKDNIIWYHQGESIFLKEEYSGKNNKDHSKTTRGIIRILFYGEQK